ncbi:MAG: redox-sensing transcriptional repressor Rex [Chitinivibrionales bacterium]|nr:redox-sensing transcriptional repressor Rex [Chitinivibrionales bacterium]
MFDQKSSSKIRNCILRLSRYKNALYRLEKIGFVKAFSDNIADAAGETASQVRKDFSLFGITGSKRGGYQIDELIQNLNAILGKNGNQKVVIVGIGRIGRALMEYEGFKKSGIEIVAGFDIDPEKADNQISVPVFHLHELQDFIIKNDIRIGIIAVPYIAARQAFDMLVAAGIKGILNFAPIHFKGPTGIVVTNVNLEVELENLIYFVNAEEKAKEL